MSIELRFDNLEFNLIQTGMLQELFPFVKVPSELTRKIFSLILPELNKTCKQVCKNWKYFINYEEAKVLSMRVNDLFKLKNEFSEYIHKSFRTQSNHPKYVGGMHWYDYNLKQHFEKTDVCFSNYLTLVSTTSLGLAVHKQEFEKFRKQLKLRIAITRDSEVPHEPIPANASEELRKLIAEVGSLK